MRVIRTLRPMGIRSVAVYSDADAGARHVAEADTAVRIGPAAGPRELPRHRRRRRRGACAPAPQAVHPGYGFLSENADFAAALRRAGIVFIGPPVARDRDDGRQDHRQGDGVAVRRAGGARHRPARADRRRADRRRRRRRLPGAGQAVGRRRRQGHAAGRGPRANCPPRWPVPAGSRPPRSATTPCSWSDSCCGPGISRCRCWPTPTATWCTSASASAACSAATRRSSRRRRRRCSTRRPGRGSAPPPATPPAASTTSARARSSSSSPPTGPTSSSSWR